MALLSAGRCEICQDRLGADFHGDHVYPHGLGGATILSNGQALCSKCNLKKGRRIMQLRPWQAEALKKAMRWLIDVGRDKHFLINAAPGAGKTIAACVIAKRLIEDGHIDRVIVIAPRVEVVRQWSRDFHRITGRYMGRVTAGGDEIEIDVCATWAAIQNLRDGFQAVCRDSRVLVICDEHHHAAVAAAWGDGADTAFADAKYVVVLTGTPIRSDGQQSVWMAYDDAGRINQPEEGTYTLSYGDAVDLKYCRPATFHRHEGHFTVDLQDGEKVHISSQSGAELTPTLRRIPGLQRTLNFYRLACTPQYEADGTTPRPDGYQGTMIEWASAKLDDLRLRMSNAGGLVIAPSIPMAAYMADLLEIMEGERPAIVHSQLANPESRIEAFRHTDKRWIVSVGMISEGVDIPRLRVLIYLPVALTELAFRQAVGRVVRTAGPDDDTRAYVVMPSFETLEGHARRIEAEMSPSARKEAEAPSTKRCPVCETEAPLSAPFCEECGHQFEARSPRFKECDGCGGLNPVSATSCQTCGKSFAHEFILTLDEALRTGTIVRGMDIEEDDTKEGEAMAEDVRKRVLASGDDKLVEIIQKLPEESWAKLKRIFE
jgi:superfamily II DNA or RNA helicase